MRAIRVPSESGGRSDTAGVRKRHRAGSFALSSVQYYLLVPRLFTPCACADSRRGIVSIGRVSAANSRVLARRIRALAAYSSRILAYPGAHSRVFAGNSRVSTAYSRALSRIGRVFGYFAYRPRILAYVAYWPRTLAYHLAHSRVSAANHVAYPRVFAAYSPRTRVYFAGIRARTWCVYPFEYRITYTSMF